MDAMKAISMGLERRRVLQEMEQEKRRQDEQDRKLAETTKKARMEAVTLGLPKAQAEALGVGELQGWIAAQKQQQKERIEQDKATRMMRDVRAASTTAKPAAALTAAELGYFAQRTGMNARDAMALWESLDRVDRARGLGVTDKAVIDDLMAQVKQETETRSLAVRKQEQELNRAKFDREGTQYAEGAPARAANLAQVRASTASTEAGTQRKEAVQKASDADKAKYRGLEPVVRRDAATGLVQTHVPGNVDDNGVPVWKDVQPNVMAALMAGGESGEGGAESGEQRAGSGEAQPPGRTRGRYRKENGVWVRVQE